VDSREQRVAKNEALFRDVNERIKDVNEPLAADGPADFLCECWNEDCIEPISLTFAEYEALRSEPTHFGIVPGHVVSDVERLVESNERYAVVEKSSPAAARIAIERDPRA
jgi:hypothetical protein